MMRFWRRKSKEQELERELQAHLELETEEQRTEGLPQDEAHFAAKRAFGNPSLVKEAVRETWGWSFIETLGQDLRYAFRSLRGSPVFLLVAVSSLGLGIGANTAIFSFVNAILLKHLPVPEPTRLVQIREYENGRPGNTVFSFPFLRELDKRNQAFDGVLARFPVRVNLTTEGVAEPLNGEVVTGNYFNTLQVKPALGRLLKGDDVDTNSAVCVISYAVWQTRFGSDPSIVGRKLLLNARPYTVVGVTERGFAGPQLQSRIDMQLPLSRMGDFMGGFFASGPGGAMWKSPGFVWLEPLARLKPGISMVRAQAMLNPLANNIRVEVASPNDRAETAGKKTSYRLADGSQGANYDASYSKPVTVLMGLVALVLLIACANLANLLLARAGARAKEFAVRLSLGASRWRLVRQLMVESLSVALCGGVVGLLLAFWIIRTLLAYLNAGQSNGDGIQATLDPMAVSFALLLSFLTAVLFGLLPAWQSAKPDVIPELKGASGSGQTKSGGVQTRRALIVLQIALSLMILFAAGLLTRTLSHLKTIDLGFNPSSVIALHIDPAMNGYSPEQSDQLFAEILERLRAQPGITAASLAAMSPLEGGMMSLGFTVPGHVAKSSDVQTNFNMVSPGYFKTLNQKMLAGREFNERDTKSAPSVAIVNELFAQQYMNGENPIGRHFKIGDKDTEIVGLVRNARYQTLRETPWPLIYMPARQTQSSGFSTLVRTSLDPQTAIAQIRRTIRSIDAKLPIYDVRELQDQIDQGISSERVLSFLSTLFSALATLLCCIGIYGLIAYAVSRRTREIGVRFAIGAQKVDVARLFLRESLLLVALGVVIGVPLALASTKVLKSLLFGVEANDSLTLALTVTVFLAAGLLASVLPVLRATRIEPLEALRYE